MTASNETPAAGETPLWEKASLALAALVFAFGLFIALGDLNNGPWMDEFNTLVTTLRGHSPAVFFEHVVRGQHPLGYEGLVYLAQAAGVTDIAGVRLINVLGLPLAFGAVWISWRRGALTAAQAAVVIALYGSSGNLISYLASVRPYFLMFSASIAAVLTWRLMLRARAEELPLGLWAGALAFFVNVHYYATIFGGLLTLALLIDRARRREWRAATLIELVSLAAAAPALILGVLQYSYTSSGGVLYYYPAGIGYALSAISAALVTAIAGNIVLCVFALSACFRKEAREAAPELVLLAAVTAGFFALLICAHLYKPMIYDRYLIAAAGAVLVAAAVMATGPATPKFSAVAICAFALAVETATLVTPAGQFNWNASAAQVASIVKNCPSATVYGVPYARVNNGAIWTTPLNPTESEARSYGYRLYAKRLGFSVAADLAPGDAIAAPGACPAIVWIEHFWPPEQNAAALLAKLQLTAPDDAYFGQVGSGVLLIAPGHPNENGAPK
jgi:hypothetical protein